MNILKKTLVFISFSTLGALSPLFVLPTLAANPIAMTTAATAVSQTSATMNGFYNSGGAASMDVRFEYGTTPLLGSMTPYVTKTNGSGTYSVTLTVEPNKQYFFRAMGVVAGAVPAFGSTLSFTTPAYSGATAMTLSATNVATSGATLNGFFNGNGSTASTKFEYANNSAFIGSYMTSSVSQAGSSGQYSANVTGLLANTTYYFRAVVTNAAGSTNASSALSFHTTAQAIPCVINSFTANPSTIVTGNTSILSWSTTNCTGAAIGNIGVVAVNGSATTPALSTTTSYTLIAGGANGNVSQTVLITVTNTSPACVINSFTANPSTINSGNTSTLSWSTTNCTGAAIGNIGTVAVNGSATTPALTTSTSYTLIAGGTNGNVSRTVLITVAATPACVIGSFTANPSTINTGASSMLSWSTANCTNASISIIGNVAVNGSTSTGALYATTTFTLSASGAVGNPTRQVTVVVNNTTTYQCNDGIDNDGDGLIDFPADPGCASPTDNNEYNFVATYQCNDGIDNDGDGFIDFPADIGCSSATDTNEYNATTTYQCNDGIDNDGDGLVDFPQDIGCSSATDNDEYNYVNVGSAPSVTTNSATNIYQNGATLNGTVNSNNSYTYTWFDYGTTSSFGSSTSQMAQGIVNTTISQSLGNLSQNTTYYFRACASNSYGQNCGATNSFTTTYVNNGCTYNCGGGSNGAPFANTSSAQNVTASSANLYGYVDPNGGTPTSVWFQYGTNSSTFGNTTYNTQSSLYSAQTVNSYVSGLSTGTTYYFRVCASNSYGQNCGSTLSFVTTGTTYNPNPYYPPTTPYTPPATIIVYQNSGTTEAVGEGQLAVLKLTANSREVARGDTITYSVALSNTASRTLTNIEMHLTAPSDLSLTSTTDGELSFAANSVTLKLPTLAIGATKTFTVIARMKDDTTQDSFVVHADASYTNTRTGGRETATAELITDVTGNGFLANVFGSGATLGTLIGLLLLLLVILMIVLLARKAYAPAPAPVRQSIPMPPTRYDPASPYR